MNNLQAIAPTPIVIPESRHFAAYQVNQIVKWYAGKDREQFYRDTMNSLRWCMESLAAISERNPECNSDAIDKLRFPIAIMYQTMLPENIHKYDFPPYRDINDSNCIIR